MYSRILVPLDGSELAEGVLPWVKSLAACAGSEILLYRVATYPHYDFLVTDPELLFTLRDTVESTAREYLDGVAAGLRAEGHNVRVAVGAYEGSVPDCIIDYADEVNADLIAMCTHGRTGPARWLLGSVASRVVNGAHRPVLMYRPLPEPAP